MDDPARREAAFVRRACACAAVLAAAALGGCGNDDAAQGPGDSLFELFQPPSPQDAVLWATDPYDADKRYRGLLLLANAPWGGEGPYLEMYRLASEDSDAGVRAMAIRALALHGSPEDAEIAIRHLDEENTLVRWESCRALQRFYAPDSVRPLLSRLNPEEEEEPQVRACAARALGQYAEPRVVEGLIRALDDRHLAVNENALQSLETLTGQDYGYDGREWLAWSRAAPDIFAQRQAYEYPIFERDKNWVEVILPFFQPPNETAGRPIGEPPSAAPAPSGGADAQG